MMSNLTFDLACKAIILQCSNEYARAYARAGIGMEGKEAKIQALYILNNITHWRGGDSKEVRAFLKEFAKG